MKDAEAAKQSADETVAAIENPENPKYKELTKEDRELLLASAKTDAKLAEVRRKEKSDSRDGGKRLVDAQSFRLDTARLVRESAQLELKNAVEARERAQKSFEDQVKANSVEQELVETIRVTLKQAYLRDFTELGRVGEVAILMTVKESRSGLGQNEPKAGRVVYYTEGARKHAFMNFRDQPVYGPIRYGGDDLQIRVSIIEIDEKDNAVAGGMLKTLASIGSIAYPPSSPVLAALDQIGASLLTLNGPDLEWDYPMRLSSRPPPGVGGEDSRNAKFDAWLRDGYYVLLRSDTNNDPVRRMRVTDAEWSSIFLDQRSGVLFVKSGEGYAEYTDRSYLVFAVQTGFDSTQLDLAQATAELSTIVSAYGAGSSALAEMADVSAKALKKSLEDAEDLRKQRRRVRVGSK